MEKYLVISGRITSKGDGDIHFISCKQLIQLYGVNPKECICVSENDPAIREKYRYQDLIPLRPLYNGKYREFLSKHKEGRA